MANYLAGSTKVIPSPRESKSGSILLISVVAVCGLLSAPAAVASSQVVKALQIDIIPEETSASEAFETHAKAIGGTHAKAIGGTHAKAIGGTHAKAIGGTHAKAIGGTHAKAIGGTHAKAIGGTHAKAIGGTHAKAIGGTRVQSYLSSNAEGHFEWVIAGPGHMPSPDRLNVLGYEFSVDGSSRVLDAVSSEIPLLLVFGNSAGDATVLVTDTQFEAGSTNVLIRGAIEHINYSLATFTLANGLVVDYSSMLEHEGRPSLLVGDLVVVRGIYY